MAVDWDLDDKQTEQPTVASPIEPVVSGNSEEDDVFKDADRAFQELQIATKELELAYANLALAIVDSQEDN